jgi:hypothetical protein
VRQWLVQLKGKEDDLKALSNIFCSPSFNIRRDEDGYYYLRSLNLATINDEGAREERAKEIVRNTNVTARLLLGENYFSVEFDGMARIEGDGKRYRSVGVSRSISYDVRTHYKESSPKEAESLIGLLDDPQTWRVISLFAQSLDARNDRLKGFLFAWSATEIFVNKAFSSYSRSASSNEVRIPGTSAYSKRVAKATELGKYALLDRFVVIAALLGDDSENVDELDSDVEVFKRIKDIRDELFHGQDILETSLPSLTVDLQSLLSKYLRRHLEQVNS